jgi:alkylation response protein AidB-like acyl-CoA dehydrogenase
MEVVDFGALGPARHADAARILREALAHLPSAYNAPGEAEAEVALRCADRHWLGHAALEGDRLVGWIGASAAAPAQRCWRRSRLAPATRAC